ncbi:DCP2-domain-containing protein [Glonium stellatum]|uniref:DCP2-domain-containing protein n=1 Tax=Glonium stellatum TaxID=574774 RepID=A0A8E2F8E0_9PEZI|nr:DCP2-domain-containing protein [Glonium stellatum]
MTETKMQLVDWLDDLCVRFIINLPQEELESVERICFQVEEAQWFYEDFIRPLDPTLPSMNLKKFCLLIFQHCPLLSEFSSYHHTQAYSEFLAYKTRVPVRGAIMLNDDMDHAVLVKGWKKGAKWSFPRGKINKDEKDLDCAIREVYEETGFDIKEAGLVGDESDMKYIEVSMREQHMRLYVFRGVPMDTYFEPRTRKEISKISWYKLSELPTLKRNRQQQYQQGNGEDMLKDNMFYMVAPFLGPLRHWIKQQRKLDRQQAERDIFLAPPPVATETDLEETEVDDDKIESTVDDDRIGNHTADEGLPLSEAAPKEENLTQLLANLGRSHRASDNLPEVSLYSETTPDPAAELKRLLSVGRSMSAEQPAPLNRQKEQNPLLAMLQGSSGPRAQQSNPPITPFEQINNQPTQPKSPHHHHPRPISFASMAPPPTFPFPPGRSTQPTPTNSRRPLSEYQPQQHQNGFHPQYPQTYRPENVPQPVFSSSHAPNIPSFDQEAPRPYQRTGDPQFAQAPQFPGLHGPAIPPASKLPPPKLTAHSLTLLNAFKSSNKPTLSTPNNPISEQFADLFNSTNASQASQRSHIPEAVSPTSRQSPFEISSVQSPRAVFSGQSPRQLAQTL